ncbi:MAG: AAA family ATPase [Gammaproteobacteria bacterium]|nr:AAA family ATPase [Gammaproteobacteria bacterium]
MALQQDLRDLMQHKGLSQSQVATQIDKSTAVVNQWLQGNYKGDSKKVDKAVEQLLERYAQRSREIKIGYVETKNAKAIQNLIAATHRTGDIQLVIGEAGLGKTMAIKEYAKKHDDVIFIEVEPTYNAKVLLASLCDKLGLTPKRNNHEMMLEICTKLDNSGRLIIVDEAELLAHKPLEILRRIHDLSGVGIVMAGMPRLLANLRGNRGEFRQLYSRVGFCYDLGRELDDEDMNMLASAAMGTDEHNQSLVSIAEGNARRLAKLAAGVNRFSEASGEPLCAEMIKQFAKRLIN